MEETIPGKTSQRQLKEVDLFIGEFIVLLEFPHHTQFQIFIFHHTHHTSHTQIIIIIIIWLL